jgi:hypothetical protein
MRTVHAYCRGQGARTMHQTTAGDSTLAFYSKNLHVAQVQLSVLNW